MKDFLAQKKAQLASDGQTYLRVKVIPGSAKNQIVELMPSEEPTLKLRIAAPAQQGRANREMVRFLQTVFESEAVIVSGVNTPVKLIKLTL